MTPNRNSTYTAPDKICLSFPLNGITERVFYSPAQYFARQSQYGETNYPTPAPFQRITQ